CNIYTSHKPICAANCIYITILLLVIVFVLCVCVCLLLCRLLPLLLSIHVFAAHLLIIICFWFVVSTSFTATFFVYICLFYIPAFLLHFYAVILLPNGL
ncbi:E5, partial [human papillomavirus 69]